MLLGPFVTATERRITRCLLLSVALQFMVMLPGIGLGFLSFSWFVALMLAFVIWIFIAICLRYLMAATIMMRSARFLREHDLRVCLKCKYSLQHADEGTCPECGEPFTTEVLRRRWRRTYSGQLLWLDFRKGTGKW